MIAFCKSTLELVDLGGGIEGLLHVSNLSHRRVEHPAEVLKVGQDIEVQILSIEEGGKRIGLGRKQLEADPWENAQERFHEDKVVTGTVRRLANFGAFVELEPGLEGLLHVSQLGPGRIHHASEVIKAGEEVSVRVLTIDVHARRISLSRLDPRGALLGSDEAAAAAVAVEIDAVLATDDEIDIAVPVHVQRQGAIGGQRARQPGQADDVDEAAVAKGQERVVLTGAAGDENLLPAIAVDIDYRAAGERQRLLLGVDLGEIHGHLGEAGHGHAQRSRLGEAELTHMVHTAVEINDRPCAFRYPRGDGVGVDMPEIGVPLEIGKGRVVREGTKVALLSYGCRLQECLKAADVLGARGLSTTVADARFAKPLDDELVCRLAREHEVLITIEEGAIGGFSSQVLQSLAHRGLLDNGLKFRPMYLPDFFIDHDSQTRQMEIAGLAAANIVETALTALGGEISEAPARA